MADELSDIGDLVFSIVIGYIGALELLYVVRHLYHWSFRHANANESPGDSLQSLQDSMRHQLADAENREAQLAAKAMKDGVAYKDGFRVDPQGPLDAEQLKNERRKELAEELERQRKIEEETRHQLERAEKELERQRQQAAEEEEARRLLEGERAREEEQKRREAEEQEAEENARRLLEAERAREEDQKRREVEEEEAQESSRRLLEAESAREEEQKRREVEALEGQIVPEADALDGLTAVLNRKEAEASEQMLGEDERQRRKLEKQKLIEENARKFLEAEQRMVEALQRTDERSLDLASAPQTPVVEEPCLRKTASPLTEGVGSGPVQTVKTQFGQTSSDKPYAVRPRALLFPGVSDEGSSNEPASSAQSSFSAQLSEDIGTGTGSEVYPAAERQEPEGEDTAPAVQYTDEYLRSLDGIKQRPLVREDGSGRRRAFKKRRSSGSSNSSRESRTSREEELRMFTSLEEEELAKGQAQGGAEEFGRIKYTSEPTLKVKGHHKRHKRSPAKDMRASDDNLRGSLEMLGEETTNPWGEVMPEHYKDTAFWKREKAMSIDEEEIAAQEPETEPQPDAPKSPNDGEALVMPQTSSFERATFTQNEEAISALKQKQSAGSAADDAKASATTAQEAVPRSDPNQNT